MLNIDPGDILEQER